MIITKSKKTEEILKSLKGRKSVLVIGCGSCATSCKTGGEDEVKEISRVLVENGISVVGSIVPQETCHIPLIKRDLRRLGDAVKSADSVLVMACGAGVQASASILDLPTVPGADSLFLGTTHHLGDFSEFCSMCGECVLAETGGICPVTRCPKGMMNGPCGGMHRGKCEVDGENDCAFVLIHERMKKHGEEAKLKSYKPPKDHTRKVRPGRVRVSSHAGRKA